MPATGTLPASLLRVRIHTVSPDTYLPPVTPTARAEDFLERALAQAGDAYVFGAEVALNASDPSRFDCSELVQWAAAQVGLQVPDGSAAQAGYARAMDVQQALRTPGALLFRPGHVAISLGDGRSIEARGRRYGVGIFNAQGRFHSAGWIPGLRRAALHAQSRPRP